ncbi:hypothetical protein SELMODRAFT_427119 [Selaginella moellendorffii]|uniref:Uncharacterized protein n=1 Tax=Selaginella moellendorffii TaxID=88036 RepID=D8SYK2_SELML|nr:hypothetical protein SELMODRAFT_427119 [Selaginella moellendorffii]
MDAGSHSHYRACWNVAFSSIDTVIAPLVGVDLQHHFAVLDGSAQIPVFWLGKLCFSTISDSVRSLSDNLCKTMRQWSINLLVQVLFSGMVMLNPRLSEAQQFQLLSAITRALEQLFLQHWLDERLMKGLIALACPDRGSRILVTYLVELENLDEIVDEDPGTAIRALQPLVQAMLEEELLEHPGELEFLGLTEPGIEHPKLLNSTRMRRLMLHCCIVLHRLSESEHTLSLMVLKQTKTLESGLTRPAPQSGVANPARSTCPSEEKVETITID